MGGMVVVVVKGKEGKTQARKYNHVIYDSPHLLPVLPAVYPPRHPASISSQYSVFSAQKTCPSAYNPSESMDMPEFGLCRAREGVSHQHKCLTRSFLDHLALSLDCRINGGENTRVVQGGVYFQTEALSEAASLSWASMFL